MSELEQKPRQTFHFSGTYALSLIGLVLSCWLFAAVVQQSLFGTTIDGETNLPMTAEKTAQFLIPMVLISSTWFVSAFFLLRQLIKIKASFSISDEGLHDVLIGGIFFSLIIVYPINFIPWEDLTIDQGILRIYPTLTPEALKAKPWLTRWIISWKSLRLMIIYTEMDETLKGIIKRLQESAV